MDTAINDGHALQRLLELTDFGLYVVTVEDGTNVFTPWL